MKVYDVFGDFIELEDKYLCGKKEEKEVVEVKKPETFENLFGGRSDVVNDIKEGLKVSLENDIIEKMKELKETDRDLYDFLCDDDLDLQEEMFDHMLMGEWEWSQDYCFWIDNELVRQKLSEI